MDGVVVRRWCRLAADALGQTRAAIDALNVYPVPDADTGTNLYRTLLSAAQAVDELPPAATPAEVWHAAAAGAMLGACGNSGIILSQLLRGLADVCGPAAPCDGAVVARALGHAAGLARAAVSRPVEGTVLTVADAAAGAVAGSAGMALAAVVLAAATAARQALGLTTGQLAALAERGVVDAGGAGLCVVLDAWAAAISGTAGSFEVPPPGRALAVTAREPQAPPVGYASPGYEVTYLLEAPAGAVAGLREELDALGDSLVIAGGGEPAGPWSVHVHVPEAGPAIEAGLRAGRPRRITVTYLGLPPVGLPPGTGHRVLAVCDTPGLAALAEAAGAEVLGCRSGVAPAASEISMAARRLGRRCIIVPNGPAARAAAAAAAQDLEREGIEVVVVDVQSAVQALPALAVHEPAAEFTQDAAAMGRAAGRMRHASSAADGALALAMTDELLAGGAELMTFLVGAAAPAGLAEQLMAHVRAISPATEVECHAGAVPGAVVLAGAE